MSLKDDLKKTPKNTENLQDVIFENKKLRYALKATSIGVWTYNADTNTVNFSNESKRIIGELENVEFGKNPQDWNNRVHPDDKEKYFQDFRDHLEGKVRVYENEHRILCKNGSYKWILDRGKIVERYDNNQPKRIIGTHVDITNYKKNESAISKSLDVMTLQNNKLKNFAHIVTHNLKSHSANFENLMEFYDEAETNTEKEELIIHLKTVSTSLKNTIKNLNDIVTVQTKSVVVTQLNLKQVITDVCKLLEVEINTHKATLINNVDPKLWINYNKAYAESIVQNLLSNALKYRHPDRTPIIEVNSQIKDNNLVLTVKDNGLGIDLDKFGDSIFGLYRTFHNNDNAEGVGLYLTKNQIEHFGGKITVDSVVNVGTTFTIIMPN